jgi:hypothetical protein
MAEGETELKRGLLPPTPFLLTTHMAQNPTLSYSHLNGFWDQTDRWIPLNWIVMRQADRKVRVEDQAGHLDLLPHCSQIRSSSYCSTISISCNQQHASTYIY